MDGAIKAILNQDRKSKCVEAAMTWQKSLSQRKVIKKKLHSVEEESLLMQYHSKNIEKLPKQNKKQVSNIA